MKKFENTFWGGIVFLFFLLTRFGAVVSARSVWFDEAFSLRVARMPWKEFVSILAFEHNPWVHFLWIKFSLVFTESVYVLRGGMLLVAVVSFGLMWLAAKRLSNERTAVYATALMTMSSLYLFHQVELRMYGLVILFTLAMVLAYWRYREDRSAKNEIIYLLAGIGLIHSHLTAWAFVMAVMVFHALSYKDSWKTLMKRDRHWWCANMFVFLTGLFWFIPIAWRRLGIGNTSEGWFFHQVGETFWFGHLTNFFLAGEESLVLRGLAIVVMIGLVGAAFMHFEKPSWWQRGRAFLDERRFPLTVVFNRRPEVAFLLITLLLPMVMAFVFQINVSKYLIASSVSWFLLLAIGLEKLPKQMQRLCFFMLFITSLPMMLQLTMIKQHHWDEAATFAYEQSQGDVVLVHSFSHVLPLHEGNDYWPYQGSQQLQGFYPYEDEYSLMERIVRYNWSPIVNDDTIDKLSEITKNQDRVLLISTTPGKQDPVKDWFWEQGWELNERKHWDGIGDPEILIFVR